MSKATELAEAEARRAEAEQPPESDDNDDTPDGDVEDPGDAPTPITEPPAEPEVNAEAQAKAFVAEMNRHADEWAGIAGVPADTLEACPTCAGAGFLDRPLKVSEHHQRCDACNGYGVVISGSLNAQSATTQCTVCSGFGHVPKVPDTPAVAAPANGTPPAPLAAVSSDPPEVAALRAAGYTIVPPYNAPVG